MYLLWRNQAAHNPVFYHWYATGTGRLSNRTVRSSRDNVCLILQDGLGTATNRDDCQRHGGRELALDGTVNLGELLINVVRTDKLKALTSLNQKVRGEVCRVSLFSHRRQHRHRRTGRTYPIRWYIHETW